MAKTIYAPGLSGKGTAARALAWVGKRFSPGWCLYWCLTQVYLVPGLGDYDHDGAADAEDYWKAALKRGKVVLAKDIKKLDDIPAGVLLQWLGGSGDHGHAAFCLGKGRMVSTDLPDRGFVGECDIELAHTKWGLTFVGYVLVDGNGFTLTRDTPPAPAPAPKTVYQVNTAAGVNIRSSPSVRGIKVGALKKGSKVTADKIVTAESRQWVTRVVGGKRQYMAREYFTLAR